MSCPIITFSTPNRLTIPSFVWSTNIYKLLVWYTRGKKVNVGKEPFLCACICVRVCVCVCVCVQYLAHYYVVYIVSTSMMRVKEAEAEARKKKNGRPKLNGVSSQHALTSNWMVFGRANNQAESTKGLVFFSWRRRRRRRWTKTMNTYHSCESLLLWLRLQTISPFTYSFY